MPNHVTSWVEITGPKAKIAKLKKAVIKPVKDENEPIQDGSIEFDFNGIIPMPKSLSITSGSNTSLGLAAHDQSKFDEYSQYPWFSEKYPDVKTPKDLLKYLEKSDDASDKVALKEGKQAAENIKQHGYPTWYEWCNEKWGTKWNAYEAILLYKSDTAIAVEFQTAWASPFPIFEELERQGFEVSCYWQDEDPSNQGTYGDPYSVFDIYIPRVEVSYIGGS